MYVCHCRAVTDGVVRASIEAGAGDLCSLARQCGAGSRCGGCHLALRELLAEAGLEAAVGSCPLAGNLPAESPRATPQAA